MLVIHNLIVSYIAAHYYNIQLNIAVYWIIYTVVCCFLSSWLPI